MWHKDRERGSFDAATLDLRQIELRLSVGTCLQAGTTVVEWNINVAIKHDDPLLHCPRFFKQLWIWRVGADCG